MNKKTAKLIGFGALIFFVGLTINLWNYRNVAIGHTWFSDEDGQHQEFFVPKPVADHIDTLWVLIGELCNH